MLLTAASYHDAGSLRVIKHPETDSCKIANEILPSFGYSNDDIIFINSMIMGTKIPQSPSNLLQEILADADFDYLYSILIYYAASRTISFVVEGLEEYTGVTIISANSELVKEHLVMKLGRSITVYKGERGFLKESFNISQPVDIVFCIYPSYKVRSKKITSFSK